MNNEAKNLNNVDNNNKLTFISTEIQNIILLKQSTENNIGTITKYYSLALTAFFAYIVFYTSQVGELKKIYAILGICFVIFATASTYFTAYTIIKNLKRRLLYVREIISLRRIANELMENIYNNKTIYPLDDSKLYHTKFDTLPDIAIMIGTAVPLMFFVFTRDFISFFVDKMYLNYVYQFSISFSAIACTGVLLLMLNLYSIHRREYQKGIRCNLVKSEDFIKKGLIRYNKKTKTEPTYKILTYFSIFSFLYYILFLIYKFLIFSKLQKWNWDINIIEFLIISLVFVLLIKQNRYLNRRKQYNIIKNNKKNRKM